MSYLNTPRLIFAGSFIAAPSTVNNDPEHFDNATFKPSYQQPQTPGHLNGWWNPDGTGNWKFAGCTVQQVFYNDGTSTTDPNADSIIGATFSSNAGTPGKLVDLDPDQQMVSQLWGLQFTLGQPQSGLGFTSDFEVAPFADIWNRYPAGRGDAGYGAFYQSVLNNIQQFAAGNSRFLKELSAAFGATPQLSIKFNVDLFDADSTSPTFTYGRVVGAIGAYIAGEPQTFIAGRALQAVSSSQGLSPTVYGQVDDDTLTLDLGNALATQSLDGAFKDVGKLFVALMDNGTPMPLTANPLDSEIIYQAPGWYQRTAGIVSFILDSDTLGKVQQMPLVIVPGETPFLLPLFAEAADGMWLRADAFVLRLNPGDTASTTFYATKFGQPASDQSITVGYDPTLITQFPSGSTPPPSAVSPNLSSSTQFPVTLPLADGTAVLPMLAADPGNPRSYIDGQLYGLTYAVGDTQPPLGSVGNPSSSISVLVWSGYTAPAQPTWTRDVLPIFQQYANLYPYMLNFVNLADYNDVIAKKAHIQRVMSLPVTDPAYMPVVRDMSRAKLNMILNWFNNPVEN